MIAEGFASLRFVRISYDVQRRSRRARDPPEYRKYRETVRSHANTSAYCWGNGISTGRPGRTPGWARLLGRGFDQPASRLNAASRFTDTSATSLLFNKGREVTLGLQVRA